jgi:hypothetical protein
MPSQPRVYHQDLNLNSNQIFNFRIHNITTAARILLGGSLSINDKGFQVYDTDALTPYFWDGVSWQSAGGGGGTWGSITGVITAQTDLISYLSTNYYPLSSNPAGYLTSFTEVDPVYTASSWYTTTNNSTNWNTAYGWGNHASAGYLTQLAADLLYYPLSSNPAGYLTSFTELDPVFTASVAAGITSTDISNWNAAYGWGDHALAGYLTQTAADLLYYPLSSNPAGYLTSYTESDPVFSAWLATPPNISTFTNDSGYIASLTTNNVLYVAKNGDDATGLADRLDKPFLTVQAAITAASSGDLVYVYPGTYSESIILKDGVNIYLTDGATISNNALKTVTDNNVAVTCVIDGYGQILNTTVGTGYAIDIRNASSDITIRAKYVECTATSGASLYIFNGTVRYDVTKTYSKNGGSNQTVYVNAGTAYLKGEFISDLDYTVLISGATVYLEGVIKALNIGSFGNSGIHMAGNGYLDFTGSSSSNKLFGFEQSGGNAYIHDAVIESLNATSAADGSAISYYGGNLLELSNVILKCANASAKSIETQGVNNKTLKVYTSSYATNVYDTTAGKLNFTFGKENLLISGTNIAHASLDMSSKLILSQLAYNTPSNGQIVSYNSGTSRAEWTTPSTAGTILHGTASGTDNYTVTITGPTAYNDGDAYLIRFTSGNTTGATLDINTLGAKDLYRNNDGLLIGGDIEDGGEMLCVYNSTLNGFQCIGTSPNTILAYVTNVEALAITKGQAVYAFGGTGDRMTVKLANNSGDATSAQTVGLVWSTSIAAGQKGFIMLQGLLDGLSILPTPTWADGDAVYLGATAGSITNVKPYAPNHLVYLGVVTTASPGSAGRMYVKVQNGYELDELHNVQAQSPTVNDVLYYFGGSPGQWKTASLSTILGYTPVSPNDTDYEYLTVMSFRNTYNY